MFIEKPWGHEIIWARTANYVGKLIHIDTEQKLSRQYHVKKDESIYVLKGTLSLEIGSGDLTQVYTLTEGQNFRIAPYTIHRFVAVHGDVDLIEVSTPELNDVIRLSDAYGRTDIQDEGVALLD